MRTFALVITVVAALTAPALAGEEPELIPLPERSVAIGIQGHTTRIGGRSESGGGPTLELALGRGRWQYFVEGNFGSAGRDAPTATDPHARTSGRVLRGMAGARWLARQFVPDSSGGFELFLLSGIGAQRFYFDGGGRLMRPEVALGFGVQGRVFSRPRLAFRIDARAVFTPNSRESALVACRGDCMSETGSSTGFMTGIAFAW